MVLKMDPPRIQAPSVDKKLNVDRLVKQLSQTEETKANQGKTRYDEIMSYLGNIEEEFSQMSITNRSALPEPSPAAGRSTIVGQARKGANGKGGSEIDDTSFLGSQLGIEDPRQAYSKIRERLMELEIEKEE